MPRQLSNPRPRRLPGGGPRPPAHRALPRLPERAGVSARALALAALLALALPAPGGAAPLRVAVSVLPEQAFVSAVAGSLATVDVLVGPGRSPATYEPTPRQMASLADAALFLPMGVPFEQAWLPRLTAAAPGLRVVDLVAAAGIERLTLHGHSHGDAPASPAGAELDPHLWTDPRLVARLLPPLADALCAADPAHCDAFRAGAAAYADTLAALDAELRAILAPVRGRRFLVFHPSWGYFAAAYGLEQVAIEHEGKEPGARALANVIDAARASGLRTIFVQRQFASGAARAVADAIGGDVIAVDPLAADYCANLRRTARIMAAALAAEDSP
ncbi:MAG: zinc ABC transporter substrate-binding protein [Candidatus Latescibacteria bacterium]|nr:zinc ABC transporter substrate-binding protein [Candidatus Latescibacterota bacterium]